MELGTLGITDFIIYILNISTFPIHNWLELGFQLRLRRGVTINPHDSLNHFILAYTTIPILKENWTMQYSTQTLRKLKTEYPAPV